MKKKVAVKEVKAKEEEMKKKVAELQQRKKKLQQKKVEESAADDLKGIILTPSPAITAKSKMGVA